MFQFQSQQALSCVNRHKQQQKQATEKTSNRRNKKKQLTEVLVEIGRNVEPVDDSSIAPKLVEKDPQI